MVKLIGLVEPKDEASRRAFEEWYLGNHIEDVSHTPGVLRATVHRLVKPFMKTAPPQYITIYEFETEEVRDAATALGDYLNNPGWSGRKPDNGSLRIISAGWYRTDRSFSSGG
jgi:hypothetical protein